MIKKLFTGIILMVSMGAFAEPYIGVGGSMGRYDADNIEFDSWTTRVFGGYQFNPNLAAEISLSQSRVDDSIDGIEVYSDSMGINVTVFPMIPLTKTIDGFICLSYGYATGLAGAGDGQSIVVDKGSDSGFGVGVGFAWHPTENVFIRPSIGSPTDDFGDMVMASVDLGFKF